MINTLVVGNIVNNSARSERYTIIGIIGRGASAIAYNAELNNGCYVSQRILKEYCPCYINIERNIDGIISYDKGQEKRFLDGKRRFLESGNLQNYLREKVSLRNQTPPIISQFEANGTIYLDITPFEGRTYDNIDIFSFAERMKVCLEVAKLVDLYHKEGYLCLDIKPSNIFIQDTTEVVEFIDFDSIKRKEDICFGNSISCTKAWAAPEQRNAFEVHNINETTDVYAIGELVFYSVFGRHSKSNEQKSNARMPYDKLQYSEVKTKKVRNLLSKLFKGTLRSSGYNRFDSMESVVDILQNIIEEISKKQKINEYIIPTKEFFLGRDIEILKIKESLQKHNLVFISGIAGIGKSELVKQYILQNEDAYTTILYWSYENNFERMLCAEDTVSISNFKQEQNEADSVYCKRKLEKIRNLIDANTLIVIDNLNLLVSELDNPDIWNSIKALPGKKIITTRCKQKNYFSIEINDIDDTEMLRKLYIEHCPLYNEEQEQQEYIDEIIRLANRHTYEIELLASHAQAEKKTPKQLLKMLKEFGLGNFDKTSFETLKDGKDSSASFVEHLSKIVSMSNMSDIQKELILKLSFVPNTGIESNEFIEFYGINDYIDLNWLISHGFIHEIKTNKVMLLIHQSVAEMIINLAKKDEKLILLFYDAALRSMRKGYDDETVNQVWCNKGLREVSESKQLKDLIKRNAENGDVEETKKKVEDWIVKEYARSQVDKLVYRELCNYIAMRTIVYKINEECAARFITQYVQWFMKYGYIEKCINYILFAKKIYDEIYLDSYSRDREYLYEIYCYMLLRTKNRYSEVLDIAKTHLKRARRAKDWKYAQIWSLFAMNTSSRKQGGFESIRYSFNYGLYTIAHCRKNNHEEVFECFFDKDTDSRISYSLLMFDDEYEECLALGFIAKWLIKNNILLRESVENKSEEGELTENYIKIQNLKAKQKMLENDFQEAKDILQAVIDSYNIYEDIYTEAIYSTYKLMGEVCAILEEYENAIKYFDECLHISRILGYTMGTEIQIKKGKVYNKWNKLEVAKNLNLRCVAEVYINKAEVNQVIHADACLNYAETNLLLGDISSAVLYLETAERIYDIHKINAIRCEIGKLRCLVVKAGIVEFDEPKKAKEMLSFAYKEAKWLMGDKHPETKIIYEKLKKVS